MSTLQSTEAEPQQLTDHAIVRRVAAGEAELFEILMRRHNPAVYRAIRFVLRDQDEVEDAMQQTYLKAFSHLGDFEERSTFATWVVRIALNEGLARGRRLRLVSQLAQDASMPSEPKQSPEDQVAAKELGGWLERAIDDLPETYRAVVMLREVEGFSTQQVAEALAVTEDAVKTRLHRARGLLREQLEARVAHGLSDLFAFHAPRCDRVVSAVMHRLLSR